jgi:hypothetical protein
MSNYIGIESNPSLTTSSDYWTLTNTNLIYNTGNVGIGVPYPRAALHIDGNASIGYNNTPQPNSLIIAGNIGIGTNNPQDKLHVNGGSMIVSGNVKILDTFQLSSNLIQNTTGGLQLPGITMLSNGNVGIGTSNPQVTLDVSGTCFARGHVIQTVTVQDTTHSVISIPINTLVTISTLNLVITPKKANSTIVLQWMVNGEVAENTIFVVMRNGSAIGLNTDGGSAIWSGTASAAWDNNLASTPSNYYISWIDTPNTTSATTYSLGIKDTNTSAAYTLYLNRTLDTPLQDFRESLISCGVAWEVCN